MANAVGGRGQTTIVNITNSVACAVSATSCTLNVASHSSAAEVYGQSSNEELLGEALASLRG
jgi:hypothetical protein